MANLEAAIGQLMSKIDALNARLENVEKGLGGAPSCAPAASTSSGGGSDMSSASVQEYDDIVQSTLTKFYSLTDKIGKAELKEQVGLLKQVIENQKQFLGIAAASKKPTPEVLQKLLSPTSELIQKIIAIRDKNRANEQFNHLSAISEGVPFAGWVAVEPKPGPHVDETRASAQFYTNKILMAFKGKDEDQVNWAKAWVEFLTELPKYIKKFHTTGVAWNPKGGDAASASPAPAAAGGAPPPPAGGPPPPPPPTGDLTASAPTKKGADMNAVFSALNKGTAITSGLRKVADSEKTKNRKPEERSSVVPSSVGAKKAASAAPKFGAGKKKGTPKCALEGNKWVVEYQEGNKEIVINPTATKETVYIFGCKNSLVQIKTKVNAITMDGCERTAVVFQDCVASMDLVNCKSSELQVLGKVPTFAIDKCSGVQLVLSKTCLDAEIISSKSDQMNVLIPDGDDLTEVAIPEQYKTVINGKKLETNCVEHAG